MNFLFLQGLALTRLIFNTDRLEDAEIEALLVQAQTLRSEAGLRKQLAETFNGLGSLKQKQCGYSYAEEYYNKALEIRRSLPEGDDKVGKYTTLFQPADIVLLNKVDLTGVLEYDVELVRSDLARLNSRAPLIEMSIRTGQGVDAWLAWLRKQRG